MQECFCLLDVHFVKPALNQYQDAVIGLDFFLFSLDCAMAVDLFWLLLLSTGKSCYQGAAAQRAEGVHQQGALQCRLRCVGHRPLGLARGLARALQPAHGDAGQRRCQCGARSHESAHRSVAAMAGPGCSRQLFRLFLVPLSCHVSSKLRKSEFSSSLPWAWCLLLALELCAQQVSWELGKEVLCCRLELSRYFDSNTLFSRYLQFLVWYFSACLWGLPQVYQMTLV